jgi:hypothetical protein
MPNIQIGKEKVPFPASMGDMPVTQGIALFKLFKEREDIPDTDTERLSDWVFRYLIAITGADKALLRQVPTSTAFEIVETITAIWAKYEPQERKYITVKGTKYFFPLASQSIMDKSTFGEWMDAQDIEKKFEDLEGGELDAALEIMAVYCRPLDEDTGDRAKWHNEEYYERLELFKQHCTTADLLDFAFFLDGQSRLSLAVLASSSLAKAQQELGKLAELMDGTED